MLSPVILKNAKERLFTQASSAAITCASISCNNEAKKKNNKQGMLQTKPKKTGIALDGTLPRILCRHKVV